MTPVWTDAAAAFVAERAPDCARGFETAQAMGVFSQGRMVAGVVFHDWWPEKGTIQVSCAADTPRWFTRPVMEMAWGYAFYVARMAIGQHSIRNGPARRIWRACGATETVIPELYGEGHDAVIATLTERQWRASRLGGRGPNQAALDVGNGPEVDAILSGQRASGFSRCKSGADGVS